MSNITKQALEASLKRLLLQKPLTKITIADITEDTKNCTAGLLNICINYGARQEIVRARQICAYLMCDMLALPLVSVGQILRRDHTTVGYSRDKVAELMRVNDKVHKEVEDVRSAILKQ